MLSKSDLWIGDGVRTKDQSYVGTYNGDEGGFALVKTHDGLIKLQYEQLELFENSAVEIPDSLNASNTTIELKTKKKEKKFADALDLHYEILSQSFQQKPAEAILDFQLRICDLFIKDAIARSKHAIHIIHGKGEGILKNHIDILLKSYPEIKWLSARMDQGSIDVLFY